MVKKKKRYSVVTKSRIFVVFMFFLIVVITLGYTLTINFKEISYLDDEMDHLNEEYELLLDDEAAINADIKRLQDPTYIARYVREKYMYSKDGEIILRIK